jgi:hypothetical protein
LCKTPRLEVVRALDGNFREEFIIVLKQCYARWPLAANSATSREG